MAQISQIHLAHLPSEISIYAALFTNVQNAPFLRQQLLDGNTDFEYAFLDARSILSTTHILAAVFRATNDAQNNRLRSRNVHSEIVFSLSPNNNIATSFRTFGITDSTTSLVAIKVSMPSPSSATASRTSPPMTPITLDSVKSHLTTHIQGTSTPFNDATLSAQTDVAAVRKAYKLNAPATSGRKRKGAEANGGGGDAIATADEGEAGEKQTKELEINVLGIMSLKGS